MALELQAGFHDALVILGAAGVVIPAFTRLKISPVIGFILVGIIAGPAGLGAMAEHNSWLRYVTISSPRAVEPFAEFGIVLLLFAIGMELSFRRLRTMRRLVFGVGAAELLLSAIVLGLGLHMLGQDLSGSIALGLALALSSTALVLPLVRTTSAVGRSALAMLLFEDLAIVPIIFALGALAPYAQAGGFAGFAYTILLGAAMMTVLLLLGRLFLPRLFAQAARTKSPELFLAASLLVVITASLATTATGLSPLMGALLAGILIAETDYRSEVEVITAPFRGLALGIFLITVGMRIDLLLIVEHWLELSTAIVAVLLVKALVTGVLLRLNGARTAVAAEAGLLMASPSETTLIVLGAAASAQLISQETAAFWQIVTAIGLTITPLLARMGQIAAQRVNSRAEKELVPMVLDNTEARTVIIGFGRVGRMVADMLATHGRRYAAVDSDIDAVTASRREALPVIFGDISRPELLDRLGLDCAEALVLTIDDPVLTARLTKKVRAAFPDLIIVARARDAEHAASLYDAGATDAVPETLESSLQLSESVLIDLGMPMGPVIASIHEKRAELRQQILQSCDTAKAPPAPRQRQRLGDALKR